MPFNKTARRTTNLVSGINIAVAGKWPRPKSAAAMIVASQNVKALDTRSTSPTLVMGARDRTTAYMTRGSSGFPFWVIALSPIALFVPLTTIVVLPSAVREQLS
jgi:hypothetical protein